MSSTSCLAGIILSAVCILEAELSVRPEEQITNMLVLL